MANNPINMSKIRQLLRLHAQGCSKLQIAGLTGIARNTLRKYLVAFVSTGMSYEDINVLSDKELEALFIKPQDKPLSEVLNT